MKEESPALLPPGKPLGGLTSLRAIWLGGATASGKSAVALSLSEQLQGEIVSVDSMQVYRGMDIGTAKPGPRDRARVPHHLLDVVGLSEEFNVATFVKEANRAIEDIHRRGKTPILCGGTGLYFKALLEGIGSGPGPKPGLRRELEATPQDALLEELRRFDPQSWTVIDRRNPRRVVRAVEILRLTGRPAVEQRATWRRDRSVGRPFFRIHRESEDLRRRIDQRVELMFRRGLVEETERLLKKGLAANRGALQAIGYRQVVEYLQGLRGRNETVALVKQRTWTFVRRQQNWFERQLPTEPIAGAGDEEPEQTAARLQEILRERGEQPAAAGKEQA